MDEPEEEISLEDLGAAYARAAADEVDADSPDEGDGQAMGDANADEIDGVNENGESADDSLGNKLPDLEDELELVPTPESIVEAALFIGHPNNQPLTAARMASLMRDVSPEEVVEMITSLNQSYRDDRQAIRIVSDEEGFRMTIAPETESVRMSMVGKVRETRLAQPAIEVLSLVVYQPGITANRVTDQRGRESGPLLNQLVRRQLLMIERIASDSGGRGVAHYYPTERLLFLLEIDSLQELPQVLD